MDIALGYRPWTPGYVLGNRMHLPPAAMDCGEADPDQDLLARFQQGDEEAFRRLYERHRAPLLRFVQRMLPDRSRAEEIAQDTWLAVIHSRDRYSRRAQFRTFLFSIARRRSMDCWRTAGRRPRLVPLAGESPEHAAPEQDEPLQQLASLSRADALASAIAALPLEQREAFLLRAEAGLTVGQIALVTGTGHETAKSRLRYAYARLRKSLEEWR